MNRVQLRRGASLLAGGLLLALAACSGSETPTEAIADEPEADFAMDSAPVDATASEATITADTPITPENYAQVMEARARAYDKLIYKPVSLDSFECGDNCYLEVTAPLEGAAPQQVLCTAPVCGDWQAEGRLPDALRGKRAAVKYGTADQVDGGGNVMAAGVRAIVDVRLPDGASSTGKAAVRAGDMSLQPGVYTQANSARAAPDCPPALAGLAIYDGKGFNSRNLIQCAFDARTKAGGTWSGEQTCTDSASRQPRTERIAITVLDATHFQRRDAAGARTYALCPKEVLDDWAAK